MGPVKSYKELDVWKRGIELVKNVYIISKSFPKEEMYGLTSQMRRAAISIPLNIAEGSARNTTKSFIQFLHVSKGSLAELDTCLLLAVELNYSEADEIRILEDKIEIMGKMLSSLIRSLTAKMESSNH